ncbi:hypothetical protein EYF80_022572 [Liparis tanakae]|uniref:Uncharacterized protein n=1 Tax=Liparis tanakae TaxID=230148 RepID=A0A4Z2HQH7_9TELE|nr:hypothetical protein EYF80_022572 [Liparis tanakae]
MHRLWKALINVILTVKACPTCQEQKPTECRDPLPLLKNTVTGLSGSLRVNDDEKQPVRSSESKTLSPNSRMLSRRSRLTGMTCGSAWKRVPEAETEENNHLSPSAMEYHERAETFAH